MTGHQLPVKPCNDVLVRVEEGYVAPRHSRSWYRNPTHQNPIANEDQRKRSNFGTHPLVAKVEESNPEIADGDPLQHAIKAHVNKVEVRKAVDHNSEQIEYSCPLCRVPRQLGSRGSLGQPRFRSEEHTSELQSPMY